MRNLNNKLILSGNPNRLHLLATTHQSMYLVPLENISNSLRMIILLQTHAEKGLFNIKFDEKNLWSIIIVCNIFADVKLTGRSYTYLLGLKIGFYLSAACCRNSIMFY